MKIKPYPFPLEGNPENAGRFYQKNAEGVLKPQTVYPKYPDGGFLETVDQNGKFKLEYKKNGNTISGRPIAPYIPSEEIREIVRLAQILKRPVLIKGEPGSGKTQLSRAVAYEWYGDDYKQHYFEWIIKSTSKAVEGIYSFDHIARLRDAQLAQHDESLKNKKPKDYRKFGPMGQAFLTSTEENPSILLIDEIDKADIDFPNDLLMELDERRFQVPQSETGEVIEANYPPVIFITSNDERELPEAFLRRCLFLYIKFPDDEQMTRIVAAHLPDLVEKKVKPGTGDEKTYKEFVQLAIKQFRNLKEEREKDPTDNKRISTSELLDWLSAFNYDLQNNSGPFARKNGATENSITSYLDQFFENVNNEDNQIVKDYENTSLAMFPFYFQIVLKSYAAVQSYYGKDILTETKSKS